MTRDAALDLPFDQYQRYRLVADIIDALRVKGERLAVLDVGGRTALLRQFLPGDEVFLVDLEASSERGLVLGDGSSLPYADNSVDALVTFDTLEHVPPAGREAFISECARVARRWVVIAGPFQAPEVEEAETLLAAFIEDKLGQKHRYLLEHKQNGLPDRPACEALLKAAGGDVVSIGHANIERWLALMCLSLYMDRDAPLRELARKFFHFYNANLYATDHAAPVYRHALVAVFDGATLPIASRLLSAPVAPPGALDTSMSVVQELLRFDLERDVLAPEWARLDEVNGGLGLDLKGHKDTLLAMRTVQDEQTKMIGQLQEHCIELRANEEELEGEMEREAEESQAAIETIEQDLAAHKAKLAEVQRNLKSFKKLNTDLAEDAAEARSQAEEVREDLGKDLTEHRAKLAEVQDDLGSFKKLNAELVEDAEEARWQADLVKETLSRDLAAHKDQFAEVSEELESHKDINDELVALALEARTQAEEVRKTVSEDIAAHKAVASALSTDNAALTETLVEQQRLREESDAAREALRHELASHELVSTDLQGEVADLRAMLESAQKQSSAHEHVSTTLERDLEGHRAVVFELREELEKIQEATSGLEAERHAACEQAAEALQARDTAVQRAQDLQGEAQALEAALDDASSRANRAEMRVRAQGDELSALNESLRLVSEELCAERAALLELRLDQRKRWNNFKRAFGPKPTFEEAPPETDSKEPDPA